MYCPSLPSGYTEKNSYVLRIVNVKSNSKTWSWPSMAGNQYNIAQYTRPCGILSLVHSVAHQNAFFVLHVLKIKKNTEKGKKADHSCAIDRKSQNPFDFCPSSCEASRRASSFHR